MPVPASLLRELTLAARRASQYAYCPHSRFPVGAAVLTENGEIFIGCNVENASYGLTMCAERNAVFQAVVHGKTQVRAVLVFTPTPEPSAPCGACRQVIYEFGPEADVISVCDGPNMIQTNLRDLLPEAFGRENLYQAGKSD
jgi:cytidine deaminase